MSSHTIQSRFTLFQSVKMHNGFNCMVYVVVNPFMPITLTIVYLHTYNVMHLHALKPYTSLSLHLSCTYTCACLTLCLSYTTHDILCILYNATLYYFKFTHFEKQAALLQRLLLHKVQSGNLQLILQRRLDIFTYVIIIYCTCNIQLVG